MTINILHWQTLDADARNALLQRPAVRSDDSVATAVATIVARVRRDGDRALRELSREFDGVSLDNTRVSDEEIAIADATLPQSAKDAIDAAIANVRCFHEAQVPRDIDLETMPGVRCERLARAIAAVGLYVPAGSAPLPSAAIMLAVPAFIAGCRRRVLCTPPRDDGNADAAVVWAANRCDVGEIYKVGGAQAIAALAWGTESIHPVDKIFGPGNAYVTAAKTLVAATPGGAAIDMPAGPSEVLVIADAAANADWVAADLLSQAEHGADSQVVLLTTCERLAQRVAEATERQLQALSRQSIARAALAHSRYIVCDTLATALDISNRYAPEHLILQVDRPRDALAGVQNAGSVFLGPWSPESVGDYCSGTNHVLPTYGAARHHSGLGVEQFMRQMTVQELSEQGFRTLAPIVMELASLEQLDAHYAAVQRRLGDK